MSAVFEYTYTVCEEDIDGQGHVNNLVYLKWMQTSAVEHSSALGWTAQRYRELGAGWVVRSHAIEYLKPAFVDQEIVVRTWVANFKKITSLRKYKIVHRADDSVLAVAETNWAFIGLEHRVPRRIPEELLADFQLVPVADEP